MTEADPPCSPGKELVDAGLEGSVPTTAAVDREFDLLRAALDYAERGIAVFPCDATNKRPLTTHGHKDASVDPGTIKQWWCRWPEAMIGAPTGENLGGWALDVDDPTLFEAACRELHLTLPATRRGETGKGYHLHFAWDASDPIRNAQKSSKGWPFPKLPGAEVRGEGGYIILPPSRHPNGKLYSWSDEREPVAAPEELLAIVRKKGREKLPEYRLEATTRGHDTPDGLRALKEECAAIRAAQNGAQESTFNSAGLKMGSLIAAGKLAFETALPELQAAAAEMPSFNPDEPWDPKRVRDKVVRAVRDGMASPRPLVGEVLSDAEISEDAIAAAFTMRYADQLRYDVIVKRWYEWDGSRWVRDETRHAYHYARLLLRQLSRGKKHLCKASVAGAVETLAQRDPTHAVTPQVWDADTMLLGTPAGTVDLRTGEVREPALADMITKQTAAAPEPGEPVVWLAFLQQALGGDAEAIRFLQQWFGYCLTGETREHALLNIHGAGGNGKSVCLNTLLFVLGDYGVTASMDTFTASRHHRHLTELAFLHGARLVAASEVEEGSNWAEARIKQVTGGDPITANYMRKDPFTFIPQFKLTVASNYAPALRNVDDAMRRRFNILPFNNKPANPDRFLEKKLQAEAGQILQWAIEGCLDWQKMGALIRPQVVSAATDEYFDRQDVFGQWLSEMCVVEAGERAKPIDLYQGWLEFSRAAGQDPGDNKKFSAALIQRGFQAQLSNGSKYYRGLALRPPAEFDDLKASDLLL